MEFVKCNLCGNEKYEKLYLISDRLFPKEERLQSVRCLNCGLVYINPRPIPEEIKQYYPPEYYPSLKEPLYIQLLQKNKATIVECFKKKGRLLDLGCGLGMFLAQMEKKGWEVYGVEFSSIACKYAKNTLGLINIYNQDAHVQSVELPKLFFDVVTMWHLIEHLHDPTSVIKKVTQLLKEDGILIIACPNFDSLQRKIFKSNWYQLDPRHLFYFTPKSLKKILKICGFKMVGISYRYFADPYLDMVDFKKSLLRWLRLERPIKSESLAIDKLGEIRKKKMLWRMFSFSFNLFCLFLSLVFGVLGGGAALLVCAKKEVE